MAGIERVELPSSEPKSEVLPLNEIPMAIPLGLEPRTSNLTGLRSDQAELRDQIIEDIIRIVKNTLPLSYNTVLGTNWIRTNNLILIMEVTILTITLY